ncbi:hypothetical protein BO86DRAFT_198321 [Aspergillus japonicus CBS 114.51]|uniref:Uncharacterized protein n=1 Tax=Aspergillus japonicus CBS 114.51 TaxID=1448312 RepID=A0A8T8WRR7_ASPJA|nr:hypothetical protein BO86DRAFT_198321 [Aspergillus japonicus CBS 114.51]RAH78019.1 hypothetical protein BO86DRAFT_198321 [Aspergillus japonicus CBS 114.51]
MAVSDLTGGVSMRSVYRTPYTVDVAALQGWLQYNCGVAVADNSASTTTCHMIVAWNITVSFMHFGGLGVFQRQIRPVYLR